MCVVREPWSFSARRGLLFTKTLWGVRSNETVQHERSTSVRYAWELRPAVQCLAQWYWQRLITPCSVHLHIFICASSPPPPLPPLPLHLPLLSLYVIVFTLIFLLLFLLSVAWFRWSHGASLSHFITPSENRNDRSLYSGQIKHCRKREMMGAFNPALASSWTNEELWRRKGERRYRNLLWEAPVVEGHTEWRCFHPTSI